VKSITAYKGHIEIVTELETINTTWHNVVEWVAAPKPPAKKKTDSAPKQRRTKVRKAKSRKAKA
jgi:hypothetical protein